MYDIAACLTAGLVDARAFLPLSTSVFAFKFLKQQLVHFYC